MNVLSVIAAVALVLPAVANAQAGANPFGKPSQGQINATSQWDRLPPRVREAISAQLAPLSADQRVALLRSLPSFKGLTFAQIDALLAVIEPSVPLPRTQYPIQTAVLSLSNQALDLESGATETELFPALSQPYDVLASFNGPLANANPVVLGTNVCDGGVGPSRVVFLDGQPFSTPITEAQLNGFVFKREIISVPFDSNDTMVVETCSGNVFKIGDACSQYQPCPNVSVSEMSVQIRYQRLR